MIFHGIAVKPGKPTVFGGSASTPFFGMPGYPTSCLSNAYMLLVPFLRKMARLPPWEPRTIDAAARPPRRLSRRAGISSTRCASSDGRAEPAFKASGDITSMANADGYIEIPLRRDVVEAGTVVTVKFF